MEKIIAIALALLTLGLAGCAPKCTSEDGEHTWGKWTNLWAEPNPYGFMCQARACETCGWYELRTDR